MKRTIYNYEVKQDFIAKNYTGILHTQQIKSFSNKADALKLFNKIKHDLSRYSMAKGEIMATYIERQIVETDEEFFVDEPEAIEYYEEIKK